MIKLKDFSAKLHKYFSKTFEVVNLNAQHTHTHTMCLTNTRALGMQLFVFGETYSGIFRVIFYISFEKIVQVSVV